MSTTKNGDLAKMAGFSDAPIWGASHTLALALAALNLDVVHRSTLRAMLPKGHTRRKGRRIEATRVTTTRRTNGLDDFSRRSIQLGSVGPSSNEATKRVNSMSEIFQNALCRFENSGWITRGEQFVLVRERRGLFDWAMSATPPDHLVIPLQDAIDRINADLRESALMSPKAIEQRRQELIAIKRLMEEGFGSNWSGRGSVRFLPKSRVI